jgi:glyoxylase-like metal-dependent hydrolase (beta-lactamase superfamily II)
MAITSEEQTMRPFFVSLAVATMLAAGSVQANDPMQMRWDAGAGECSSYVRAPIQVQQYDAGTYILRENLCDTWEAPFMYLLVGSNQALLIDTGDVADPKQMPLAMKVLGLLPGDGAAKLPLLVVHSHGHLDHRAGDAQFLVVHGVRVVGSDLASVREYFGFKEWPQGAATINLGGRLLDVLPTPGHHPAHLVFYDRNTGLLFSGDFLLPGRILVDDLNAYRTSAARTAEFVKDKPVSYVLGGHIEKDRAGKLLDWQSTHHPDEAPLPLAKADLLALPEALAQFNGFYTEAGSFVIANPIRNLIAVGTIALVVLAGLGFGLYRIIKRRRKVLT